VLLVTLFVPAIPPIEDEVVPDPVVATPAPVVVTADVVVELGALDVVPVEVGVPDVEVDAPETPETVDVALWGVPPMPAAFPSPGVVLCEQDQPHANRITPTARGRGRRLRYALSGPIWMLGPSFGSSTLVNLLRCNLITRSCS
jgi:hypothetical protein